MVEIEQILNILDEDESTKDVANPIDMNIAGAEIEFKNVSFTYDYKKPKEEQR